MGTNKGTNIYCPFCKSIQNCRVRTEYDSWGKGNAIDSDYEDIHYFQRIRQCNRCLEDIYTVEIDTDLIDELKALRKLVEEMKLTMNKYQAPFKKSSLKLKE